MLGRINDWEISEKEGERSERHPQMSKLAHMFRSRYPEMENKSMKVGIYDGTL